MARPHAGTIGVADHARLGENAQQICTLGNPVTLDDFEANALVPRAVCLQLRERGAG